MSGKGGASRQYQDFDQPSVYLLASLLILLAIALTRTGAWLTLAWYGLGLLIYYGVNRANIRLAWQSLTVEYLFLNVMILSNGFATQGTPLWQWGWLMVTWERLMITGTVSLKCLLSLMAIHCLLGSLTQQQIFQALLGLRVPPLLVAVMESMLRYLELLKQEFQTVYRAALARNFCLTPQRTRWILAQAIGSLFIRTYDRGDRVYQAMVARGYQGLPKRDPSLRQPFKASEWSFLAGIFAWLGFGQFL